jgi:transposase-like protein
MDRVGALMNDIASWSRAELDALMKRLKDQAVDRPREISNPLRTAKKPVNAVCPDCGSRAVKGHGKYRGRHRYKCLACSRTFNELSRTALSGVHDPAIMRDFAAQMAGGGVSLRRSAKDMGIAFSTAFNWRHKVLKGYSVNPSRKLKGIAEADETFFLYSEKGCKTISPKRKSRKRGGSATKRGISDEQVPVILGCDRQGEMVIGVAGRGRISLQDINRVLGDRIDANAIFCTDSHSSFRAFAKASGIKYRPVNISKGQRVIRKIYHIQHANSAHTRLKGWMGRFNGVSTKYLDNYMQWFGLMEETKPLDGREKKFVERSVTQRHRN